jgi:maltose alpha-D-glucosyltransferase / alpha-amylase
MTRTVQQVWIGQALAAVEEQGRRPLIEFLQRQRWFGGKGRPVADVRVTDAIAISRGTERRLLAVALVEYRGGGQERYTMPLTIRTVRQAGDATALAGLPESSSHEWVCDATQDAETWMCLYDGVAKARELPGQSGCLMGRPMPQGREELSKPAGKAAILSAEQSNTSVIFDRRVILKLIRKLEAGINPDSEVLEFLMTQTTCRDVPVLLGVMTYDDDFTDETQPATVAVLQRFVPNVGDGWNYTLAHLGILLEEGARAVVERGDNLSKAVAGISGPFLGQLRHLGEITAGLHAALASRREPEAFCPEPVTMRDVDLWQSTMKKHLAEVCHDLRALRPEQQSAADLTGDDVTRLEAACRDRIGGLRILSRANVSKMRQHGDYHLGQILKTNEGFVVIDFEGEPARPLEERRGKVCPLKDVAGMLRSFNYAAHAALKRCAAVSATEVGLTTEWEGAARAAFLDGYRSVATPGQAAFLPATWEQALRVMEVYELDKALYELRYEMQNRPGWLAIPLAGIRSLVGRTAVTG